MKKYLVGIAFMCCLGIFVNAQTINITDSLESDKIMHDSVFISKLAALHNKHSSDILQLFNNCNREADDLGFGYYSVEGFYQPGIGSNININYQFIFRHEKLISYQLNAYLPIQKTLIEKYKKFYSVVFNFNTNSGMGDRSNPIYHNYSDMTKPLDGVKSITKDKEILFFMTPFSGTMYGGEIMGYAWSELANRKYYKALKAKITPEIDYILLYSLNSATRLSAIEYYYQHSELFKDKTTFEARIRVIYKEIPIITTIVGTTPTNQNAEELVRIYANIH